MLSDSSTLQGHNRKQVYQMLEQGIIEESCSPWMAPAVIIGKNTVKDA